MAATLEMISHGVENKDKKCWAPNIYIAAQVTKLSKPKINCFAKQKAIQKLGHVSLSGPSNVDADVKQHEGRKHCFIIIDVVSIVYIVGTSV